MPTHAELAARLLTDSATFFRNLADQNDNVRTQMEDNAKVFEQMAVLVVQNPTGMVDNRSFADMSASLLKDAAGFFRNLAEQNEPIKEQMLQNASVYEQIADLLRAQPDGHIDD